ncbi:MAG: YgaP family membrane protein [Tepidisphaeraceae bacterium]
MNQTRHAVQSMKEAVSHVDMDAVSEKAHHGLDLFKNLPQNVSEHERSLSVVGGALLAGAAMTRLNRLSGLVLLALGSGLLFRGTTGHCALYKALDVNTKE